MSDIDQLDDETLHRAFGDETAADDSLDGRESVIKQQRANRGRPAMPETPTASTPARGAMAAITLAAVPATGVTGALLYGNFGPMGVVAAGGVAAAAGGAVLVARRKKAADAAKAKLPKGALPPHPLGGLGGLKKRMSEKAAGRRAAMAERRAARQGTAGGAAGAGSRRPAGMASRVRSALGAAPKGRGAAPARTGSVAGRSAAGRTAAGSGRHGAAKPSAGRATAARHGAAGGRATGARGGTHRPTGHGRTPGGAGRGAAGGRYTNPATGRPMSTRQVASAMRQQQRAQRIVTNGGGRPTQVGRWAWRHRRVAGRAVRFMGRAAGVAAVGLVAAGFVAAAVPVAAVAAVGLGAFRVARHPAMRRLCRRGWVATRYRSIMIGRWLRSLWRRYTGRRPAPLEGDIVTDQTVEPEVIDGEIVDTPPPAAQQPELLNTPQPDPADDQMAAPASRQPHLLPINPPVSNNEENKIMSNPFDVAIEALAAVSFVPESGQDAEEAIDGAIAVVTAAANAIAAVVESINEHLPQAAESMEHLSGFAEAVGGLGAQASEQAEGWKESANWVWSN